MFGACAIRQNVFGSIVSAATAVCGAPRFDSARREFHFGSAARWHAACRCAAPRVTIASGVTTAGVPGGRDPRTTRAARVESCLALDVNELRRKGALVPGASGTLTWARDCDTVASADFRANTAGLILCYDAHGTEVPKVIEQRVALSFVPATFSGARAYFLCPGAECGRRVSVLYFRRGVFRCRRCHGLAYESQREGAVRRARRRADKLRARLGWPQRRALVLPIAVKPKGMWSKTFERLRGYAIAAESIAAAAQVAHWTRLLGRFERRKRRAQQT